MIYDEFIKNNVEHFQELIDIFRRHNGREPECFYYNYPSLEFDPPPKIFGLYLFTFHSSQYPKNTVFVFDSNRGIDPRIYYTFDVDTPRSICQHEWATYDTGFITKYDYCKKCDKKREENS